MSWRAVSLTISIVAVFLGGFSAGQGLPSTFIQHPMLTMRMMQSYPITASVNLADSVSTNMREYFNGHGIERGDIGIIEGYVAVEDSYGRPKLNLNVRFGSVFLHSVDRSFFQSRARGAGPPPPQPK